MSGETGDGGAVVRGAREYLRVSKGRGRTARSIRDQRREIRASEAEHGPWVWGESYRDTGSASKYARRIRDDFERMLSDLKCGAFGDRGDVLVLWEISRLARETGRGVELVDACEEGGYLIHISTHERTYNPANYQDRHSLIAGINDSEKEARLLSVRTLRGLNAATREGRPQGQVPYGYMRDYEVVDGRPRPVAQYPEPTEGPIVAELFVRVAGVRDNRFGIQDGENVPLLYTNADAEGGDHLPTPMYALAREWEGRGIVSRDRGHDGEFKPGIPFSPASLRSMLLRPAYASLRTHKGQIVQGEWAQWTPIVTKALYWRVQKILADRSRRTYTGESIKHVLSVTLRCGPCGAGLVVMARRNVGGKDYVGYVCGRYGHVWVPKDATDRLIIGDLDRVDPDTGEPLPPQLGVILQYLAAPNLHAALKHRPGPEPREAALRAALHRQNHELGVLRAAPRPSTALAKIERTTDIEEMETQIAALERQLDELTSPNPLADLLPDQPIVDVVAWWKAAGVQRQRAVAARLLAPDLLGQVRFMPVQRRKGVPVAERIAWHRTELLPAE